jgi:hypothetical protein
VANQHASKLSALEERFWQVTEAATAAMEATDDLQQRALLLKDWEKHIDKEIRPAYKAQSDAIRVDHSMADVRREALSQRAGQLTKAMVVERARLEGLAEGGPPKRHQAGGAFWPPSDCGPQLVASCREILATATELFQEEASRRPEGELRREWLSRCRLVLEDAMAEIQGHLETSGTEYRAFYDELWVESRRTLFDAYRARGALPQDHADQTLRRELEKAEWAESKRQEPVGPPAFELVTIADLPTGVRSGPPDENGVYARFYSGGHLKEAILIQGGRTEATLKLSDRVAGARYEDSASVSVYRPDGIIEDYSGRYDHESPACTGYRKWVQARLRQMLEQAHRAPVDLRRPGRRPG